MKRFLNLIILVTFCFSNFYSYPVFASVDSIAPSLLKLTPSYEPIALKGLKLYPNDPFKFDFLLDEGNTTYTDSKVKEESVRLINYFLTALTIPDKELWVNLSPYEQQRVIPNELSTTQMGADMLSQDYILKQLASSLTYPDTPSGKQYWNTLQGAANGLRPAAINNFQKVWIVPDKSVIYTDGNKAYVGEATLKVLCEADYLALQNNQAKSSDKDTQAFKANILPLLTKEVNEGSNFIQLRQMYKSLVLAAWFKKHLKENIINKIYSDQKKTPGVDTAPADIKEKVYNTYIQSCRQGVYNIIKSERTLNKITRRSYFSGGLALGGTDPVVKSLVLAPGKVLSDTTQVTAVLQQLAQSTNEGGNDHGLYVNENGTRWMIYLNHDQIQEYINDFKVIFGEDVTVGQARRFIEGHEAFHALVDYLRDTGHSLVDIDTVKEEFMANQFGYAYAMHHIQAYGGMKDALVEIGKILHVNLVVLLDRDPDNIRQLLAHMGILVTVEAKTPPEIAELKTEALAKGYKVKSSILSLPLAFTQAIEKEVKALDFYDDATIQGFIELVGSWKINDWQIGLVGLKNLLDQARQVYASDKNKLAGAEEKVIRTLAAVLDRELMGVTESAWRLPTRKNRQAACVVYMQVFYILGRYLGLSPTAIHVSAIWNNERMQSGIGHVDTLFDLSNGTTVMTNTILAAGIKVSSPFSFNSTFIGQGNSYKLINNNNPLGLHREIRRLDAKGLVSDIYSEQGREYSRMGQVDQGIVYCNHAIEFDPNNAGAHNNLGASYAQRNNPDDSDRAIAYLRKALELDPDFVTVYINLGVAYAQRGKPGDLDRAIASVKRAIQIDPNHANAPSLLEHLYELRDESDDLSLASTSSLSKPVVEPFAVTADPAKRVDVKPAAQETIPMAELPTDSPVKRNYLGVIGMVVVSAAIIAGLVYMVNNIFPKPNPNMPDSKIGIVDDAGTKPDVVKPVIAKPNGIPKEAMQTIKDGVKALEIYDDQVAQDFAEMVLSWKDASGQPALMVWKAELGAARRQYRQNTGGSLQDKEKLAQVEAKVIWKLVAQSFQELGRTNADWDLRDVVKDKRGNCVSRLQVYYLLGKFLGLSPQGVEVTKLWDNSPIPEGMAHVETIFTLSNGMKIMNHILKEDAQVVSEPFDLGKTFTHRGNWWELTDKKNPGGLYRRIRLFDSNGIISGLDYNRGFMYEAQDKGSEAIQAYQAAIKRDPNNAMAQTNLGNIYAKQGKDSEAIQAYQDAIKRDPNHSKAYSGLGITYMKHGDLLNASINVTRALDADPNNAVAHGLQKFLVEARGLNRQNFSKPLFLNNKYQGLFYRSGTKTKPVLATNRSLLEAHKEDFREVLPEGAITVERMQRFIDGHEALHALVDMLRAYDPEVATIYNYTEEEPLANVWGVAFADGHVRIPPQLNRAVAILERALNKKLRLEGESQINLAKYIQNLDLYDSASPKDLEQVLKGIGIDVEVVDATPEQLAELKKGIDMQIVQDGLGYTEHDVGGIDYHQGLNIQEKGRGITINNISSSLNLDSATLRGFKVEIIGLERRNREV